MKIIILAVAALVLSACATHSERVARQRAEAAQINTAQDTQCRSYGATPGTQMYFQCRMMLNQQAEQNAQIDAAAQRQAWRDLAARFQRQNSPSLDCTTTALGSTAHTSCN